MALAKGNFLVHHGIQGQKWGVRRFQNPDGSLTPAGRERYSKEVKDRYTRSAIRFAENADKLYVKAYNRAVDRANAGDTDRFNEKWEREHGKNFDESYDEAFNEHFSKLMDEEYDSVVKEFVKNDEDIKIALALVEKYGAENLSSDALSEHNSILEILNR